jgi:hypothetical protein
VWAPRLPGANTRCKLEYNTNGQLLLEWHDLTQPAHGHGGGAGSSSSSSNSWRAVWTPPERHEDEVPGRTSYVPSPVEPDIITSTPSEMPGPFRAPEVQNPEAPEVERNPERAPEPLTADPEKAPQPRTPERPDIPAVPEPGPEVPQRKGGDKEERDRDVLEQEYNPQQ